MTRRDEEGRDKEGFKSTLPVWIVEPGERTGTLNLTCPRKGCDGKFIVSKKRWQEGPRDIKYFSGRSCPYCFKTSRMPLKIMPRDMRKDLCVGEYRI